MPIQNSTISELERKAEASPYGMVRLVKAKHTLNTGITDQTFAYVIIAIHSEKSDYYETYVVRITPLINAKALSKINSEEDMDVTLLTSAITDKNYSISLTINHKNRTISFNPNMSLYLPQRLRHKGLGSYAMSQLINVVHSRVKGYHYSKSDLSLPLKESNAETSNAYAKFLEHFGFMVDYEKSTDTTISIREMDMLEVRPNYNTRKIEELDFVEYLVNTITNFKRLEQEMRVFKDNMGQDILAPDSILSSRELIKWLSLGVIALTFVVLYLFL